MYKYRLKLNKKTHHLVWFFGLPPKSEPMKTDIFNYKIILGYLQIQSDSQSINESNI